VKRKLHKQNQEIRQKRRELQHLKTIEKQLLQWLEQTCDDNCEEIPQEKQVTIFDSMIAVSCLIKLKLTKQMSCLNYIHVSD